MDKGDYSNFSDLCLHYGDDIYLLEENQAETARKIFPFVAGREIMVDKIVLLLCRGGTIDLRLNHHNLHITPNTALIILPRMIVETLAVSEDASILTLLLSERFTKSLNLGSSVRTSLSIRRQPLLTMPQGLSSAFLNIYGMIRGMLQQPSHPHLDHVLRLLLEAAFFGIGPYLLSAESMRVASAAELHTEQFLHLVEQNFRQHHALDWYAQQLDITPKRLSICVKQTSGRNSTEWIDQHILLEADKLLRDRTLTVKEIASFLGFPNQSSFGTWFKRHTNICPSKMSR
ncbi:MAG: AraC family transcriptional regulator [Bacteroidales bacterium]|nr:AraC family transcriptional regulator [Bacteroidales bacterium]